MLLWRFPRFYIKQEQRSLPGDFVVIMAQPTAMLRLTCAAKLVDNKKSH